MTHLQLAPVLFPAQYLERLSLQTPVDRYAQVLHGRKMFYLLLYGMLENEQLSQPSREDNFNDPLFKQLFQLDATESVRRSSISERLFNTDADYFRQIYKCIFAQYAALYSGGGQQKYKIIRVNNSLLSDTTGKLQTSIGHSSGKKAAK